MIFSFPRDVVETEQQNANSIISKEPDTEQENANPIISKEPDTAPSTR